jgi:CRP-like cAMP-binding protein
MSSPSLSNSSDSNTSDEILQALAPWSKPRTLLPNQILFQESDTQSSLFIVQSGLIELAMHVPGRSQVPILSVASGELIAWSALLTKQPMTCSAKAIEESQLLEIPVEAIEQLASQNPTFGKNFYRWIALGLSHRLTATRLQLLDLFQHPNA